VISILLRQLPVDNPSFLREKTRAQDVAGHPFSANQGEVETQNPLVDMGITPHTPTQNRTCAINAYGFSPYILYFIGKTNSP
jgi:hypothetical protein